MAQIMNPHMHYLALFYFYNFYFKCMLCCILSRAQFIFMMYVGKGLTSSEGFNLPADTGLSHFDQIFTNHVQQPTLLGISFGIYIFYWQQWIHTLSHLRQGHFVYPITDRSSKSLLKNVICPDKPINAPSSV